MNRGLLVYFAAMTATLSVSAFAETPAVETALNELNAVVEKYGADIPLRTVLYYPGGDVVKAKDVPGEIIRRWSSQTQNDRDNFLVKLEALDVALAQADQDPNVNHADLDTWREKRTATLLLAVTQIPHVTSEEKLRLQGMSLVPLLPIAVFFEKVGDKHLTAPLSKIALQDLLDLRLLRNSLSIPDNDSFVNYSVGLGTIEEMRHRIYALMDKASYGVTTLGSFGLIIEDRLMEAHNAEINRWHVTRFRVTLGAVGNANAYQYPMLGGGEYRQLKSKLKEKAEADERFRLAEEARQKAAEKKKVDDEARRVRLEKQRAEAEKARLEREERKKANKKPR